MKKEIEGWTLDDWDGQFDPMASKNEVMLEWYSGAKKLYIEHDEDGYGNVSVTIPIEVMREFLRMIDQRRVNVDKLWSGTQG